MVKTYKFDWFDWMMWGLGVILLIWACGHVLAKPPLAVQNSVVQIGFYEDKQFVSSGSGIVVYVSDSNTWILTCNHVVRGITEERINWKKDSIIIKFPLSHGVYVVDTILFHSNVDEGSDVAILSIPTTLAIPIEPYTDTLPIGGIRAWTIGYPTNLDSLWLWPVNVIATKMYVDIVPQAELYSYNISAFRYPRYVEENADVYGLSGSPILTDDGKWLFMARSCSPVFGWYDRMWTIYGINAKWIYDNVIDIRRAYEDVM